MTSTKHRSVDGGAALVATAAALGALVSVGSPVVLAGYTTALAMSLVAWTRNARIAWVIVKWCLPFVLPLLLVHGVLNAAFPVDRWYFGFVPVREAGLRFGVVISWHVALFGTVAAYWMNTRRDDIVDDLVRLRLPLWFIMFASQSIAIGANIERRITTVYVAQRARGIRTGPSFWARVQALPTVLIPVVVGTLLEAEARVPALVSRGFGCTQLAALPKKSKPLHVRLWMFMPLILLVAATLLSRSSR